MMASTTQEKFSFPFPPYKIQEDFMEHLVSTLERNEIGIFESPTGTGKSMSIICGALTWLTETERKRRAEMEAKINGKPPEEENEDWLTAQAAKLRFNEEIEPLITELDNLDKIEETVRTTKSRLTTDRKLLKSSLSGKSHKRKANNSNDFDDLKNDIENEGDSSDADIAPSEENLIKTTANMELEDEQLKEKYHCRKIFYCARTHSQLAQFLDEVKKTKLSETIRVVTLGSRQTLCINSDVRKLATSGLMNDRCLELQKKSGSSKASCTSDNENKRKRQKKQCKCPFYNHEVIEQFSEELLTSVEDMGSVLEKAKDGSACPYYASRYAVPAAQLVLLPYQMLLHESTRKASGIQLHNNVIIVDEAHNLLDAVSSMYSAEISKAHLITAQAQLSQYVQRFRNRLKASNLMFVRQLAHLLFSLICSFSFLSSNQCKVFKVQQFLFDSKIADINLFKLLQYLDSSQLAKKLNGFAMRYEPTVNLSKPILEINFDSVDETSSERGPSGLLGFLKTKVTPDQPKLADPSTNVIVDSMEKTTRSSPLFLIKSFVETLTFPCEDGRVVQKAEGGGSLRFLVLNPAAHLRSVLHQAKAVVLAGGTMEPVYQLTDALTQSCQISKDRITRFSCGHVISSKQLYPVSLGAGPTGTVLNFSFQSRTNKHVLSELGRVLLNLTRLVPKGMVVFFPSYDYEVVVSTQLESDGILKKIAEKKRIFREHKESKGVEVTLAQYSRAVRVSPNGAVIFAVIGGKMSEGINFSDDLGRCVVIVGMPYPNKTSPELKEKLDYLDSVRSCVSQGRPSAEYYDSLCWKAVNQSVGRAIRHKQDFASVVLLDERYCNRERTARKLPSWIGAQLSCFPAGTFGSFISGLKSFFSAQELST